MKKTQLVALAMVAGTLMVGTGAAGAWWAMHPASPKAEAKAAPALPAKYVSLEKVIVMLRREAGEGMSHYMAVDLVFTTEDKREKVTRDHLPMLRSVAVRALSALTPSKAGSMNVDELAEEVKRAYAERYASEQREQPFSDVMIGKLVIE
jgi:flagellar protein FliL